MTMPERTFIAAAALLLAAGVCRGVTPAPGEMSRARDFSSAFAAGPAGRLPFSFTCGGRPSSELLKSWKIGRGEARVREGWTERTIVYSDPATGIEIRCLLKEFRNHPAVEWVLELVNGGRGDTPIFEALRPLDMRLESRENRDFVIHRALGDTNSALSFAPVDDVLTAAKPGPLVLAPTGGKSSDGQMPFFNVDQGQGGIAAAVGWSGQWEAAFERGRDGALRFRAGQQLTHLRLHPGETVRTPRILLVFWDGAEAIRGNNLFRQVLLAHYLPRRNGSLVMPPICATVNQADPDGNYERPHTRVMPILAERGIEVFWSDMDPQQWYPKGFPEGTGTWEPDPVKYPNGLKPVGDAAAAAGLGYLLWFEPERVYAGTKIDTEHPEFVMTSPEGKSRLFRLQDARARKWLTDLIDVQISAARLAWLRWDFNIRPLEFWRRDDAPDRQGITEIRYVEGLYAMWDDLRARHPGLVIDNCAGGGRRIDLETLSRGLPLWHSDMQCEGPKPAADQLQNGGLFRWVPLHGCGDFAYEPSYVFRSAMTAGNIVIPGAPGGGVSTADAGTAEAVKKTAAVFHKLRPFMVGDFYPLLPHDAGESAWYGYQFDNPGLAGGCAILFRREKSTDAVRTIRLNGIAAGSTYEITFEDAPGKRTMKGETLTALPIEIPAAPGSAIVYYKKIS